VLTRSTVPPALGRLADATFSTRLYTCVYNARQYSVVKDLDCLGNQFKRVSTRFNSLPNLAASCFRSFRSFRSFSRLVWWAQMESNHRPHPYQGCALAI